MAASNRAEQKKKRPRVEIEEKNETEARPRKIPKLERSNAILGTLFSLPHVPKKSRSDIMLDHLNDLPFISEDRKFFRNYLILHHAVVDFTQPIASIGAQLSRLREILILNPESSELNQLYTEITADIKNNNLTALMLAFTQRFKKNPNEDNVKKVNTLLEKWVADHSDDSNAVITTLKSHIKIPVMPLEYFIEQRCCFCRHYSLFMAFVVGKLIQAEKLTGQVFHHRDTIEGQGLRKGNHSWVVLKTVTPDHESVYIIDTVNWRQPLELHENRDVLVKAFGEDSVARMEHLYWSTPQPAAFLKQ